MKSSVTIRKKSLAIERQEMSSRKCIGEKRTKKINQNKPNSKQANDFLHKNVSDLPTYNVEDWNDKEILLIPI